MNGNSYNNTTQSLKLKTQNHNLELKANLRFRSYQFALNIIKFVDQFPSQKNYIIIANQLLRCATSIGANIIEAKSSSSKKDFIKFYEIALKSANETEYWLNLLKDSNLSSKKNTDLLLKEINEISKMLASSLLTLKGKKY